MGADPVVSKVEFLIELKKILGKAETDKEGGRKIVKAVEYFFNETKERDWFTVAEITIWMFISGQQEVFKTVKRVL